MDCAECGSANREGRRFCGGCGAALAAACEACGFVNEAAEKFCGGCGTALAPGSAAALPATIARTRGREPAAQGEAERRQLTVMFCDLVGSTALSARFDPEDLRELIGAFQQASVGVIERMGGIVARYMGDGLLVYFGYPQAGEDDAERAVSAGLGVVEAVAALAVPDDVRLRVRVGIATGLVVAGDIVGEGAAEEHAVLGETPNLAARLQGLAEPDTVVIGPVTHRLVGGLFECAELGQHTLKGFPEPVSAWRVMGASEAETRFDALRIGTLTPLVGREKELDLLADAWRSACRGDGGVAFLTGEAGIGKSRIVQALAETAAGEAGHTSLNFQPAYPWHSACGKAYVLGTFLTREVTDMGFKVASRVRGLSDEAFREAFGAEEQCRSALSRLRWPDGFVCPACGHRGHCVLAGRSLYQCNRCKKQTSSTAGTIFHATKLPLTLWFAAVHLIVTAKNGISSVELGRRLGVKQPTAWTMKHKIMAVMARREADTPLSGRVEMDDAYLGGARAGGKRGRGAPGKTPFVAAVSTSPEGRPRKVKLVPVKGFRKREIARGAKRWLAPGSEVLTDGLRCWNALDGVVGSHRAIRTGSGRQAARMAPFKWVNTTLGNIKSAITGTYRKLGPDHAQRYLASFAWRYNRRYQLNTMIPRFVHSAARTQPIPYRALIAG